MDNATHIGRVGTLAVALGIGMAVASSPGLAYAEPTDAGSATSQDTAPAARSGATHAAQSTAGARTRRQPLTGARQAASAPAHSAVAAAAVGRTPRRAQVLVAPSVPSVAVATGSTAVGSDSAAPSPSAGPAAAVVAFAAPNPVDAIGHAVTATVAQFLDTVLSPLADGGPLNPAGTPLLWTALAFARRELGEPLPGASTASVTTTSLTMSENLIVNGGAESGDPSLSGNSSVSIPGWTVTGTPTVIGYGTPRNMWPVGLSSATPNLPAFMGFPTTGSGAGDTQFFGGGNVATSSLTQTVALIGPSAAGVTYDLSADLGGWLINPGAASVKVDFLDANKLYLGTASIGPVSLFDRFFQTTLLDRSTTGTLPTGTQYAQVTVNLKAWNPIFPGLNPDYNSAFADNISFTVSDPTQTAAPLAPPVSTVGALDHVYMVYMENKGYDDIVGSPNAPFLNSLINAYGFADNYYALTHGSLPNYYPIVGGTDFGKTYNCKDACIDSTGQPTLVSNIDAAGLTWRSYAQGLVAGDDPLVSSGEYAVDETPFPAFTSIANNPDPTYVTTHIVPLEQMEIDLQSSATAPNYAWFAADENFAGEGPTDFPVGLLKFAFNQISPYHQYNVPALDQYLSETVPMIMASNAWNDPTQKSALVVTFDEDNNNLSLGFGNEGNHIVTVVIASPGAIAAGMTPGHFVDTTHYDHYSLLATIEDALGLPTLTNNDKYAVPMNGFWGGSGAASTGTLV
ncbi:MAG: alkaline phosphatase family protein [Mycobacterium sp.]